MTTTTVHVLRHGEVHNPTGVLYGRLSDYHLSTRGREMADRVAEHLADAPLTHLVSSPLERARETIAPIAAGHPDLGVTIDARVIEAANAFQGMTFGGNNAALRDPKNWWLLRNPLRPSWGEPYVAIVARMRAAIADAAAAAGEGGEALIVSHQLPIWMARCDAEGRRLVHDPRSRECTVASLTSFHFRSGRVVRVSYAEPARDLLREKSSSNFSTGA
ncbi:MAG TPA: histidine phosphatase family protein [Propionibacteriaceae bacterium]|nr:histidine phosphatase family protein [Propionibacteriaceae bacterium]